MQHNDFKENAEGLAAKKFLPFYNNKFGTNYQVVESEEVTPDVHCRDLSTGQELRLEITNAIDKQDAMTWTRLIDQPSLSSGIQKQTPRDKLLQEYKTAIQKKLAKAYGKDTALVVFHFGMWSPSAEDLADTLATDIDYTNSLFDKGVWLVDGNQVFLLHPGST